MPKGKARTATCESVVGWSVLAMVGEYNEGDKREREMRDSDK